jgi:3-phosphoshikimate 1-carboxyvinyltransferase
VRARIEPGGVVEGVVGMPGDKSIAHRWLILAATGEGTSVLEGIPASLDLRSTASCLAAVARRAAPVLEGWARQAGEHPQGHRFTWDHGRARTPPGGGTPPGVPLQIAGEGRAGLSAPSVDLDCGNSGTTARLLAGVVAARPFTAVVTGDASLRQRPMERVAAPLRTMGAVVETTAGGLPMRIRGGGLHGAVVELEVPSAQVKSSILLAGLAASGRTVVVEPVETRDHTERALSALGAPMERRGGRIVVGPFQHGSLEGRVPGDVSSAAFLVAGAALTGAELTIAEVGLNPTRTRALDVMARMGVACEWRVVEHRIGEPVGEIRVRAGARDLRPIEVDERELPAVIDEVPILAMLAAHAPGESRFAGAGELRVKESDRLSSIARGIERLGGRASVDGDDLVVAGVGLAGGSADAGGDHRMAMAFAIGALAARAPVDVVGMEAADVSFPGFMGTLQRLGARVRADG